MNNKQKEWEVFFDNSYRGLWACRNKNDKRFNSPDLHHFKSEAEAELKKEELENKIRDEKNRTD